MNVVRTNRTVLALAVLVILGALPATADETSFADALAAHLDGLEPRIDADLERWVEETGEGGLEDHPEARRLARHLGALEMQARRSRETAAEPLVLRLETLRARLRQAFVPAKPRVSESAGRSLPLRPPWKASPNDACEDALPIGVEEISGDTSTDTRDGSSGCDFGDRGARDHHDRRPGGTRSRARRSRSLASWPTAPPTSSRPPPTTTAATPCAASRWAPTSPSPLRSTTAI